MSSLDKIKYCIIDVDGTLTDGGIYYDEKGNEFKKFSTKDAAGFFALNYTGIETIILTGRKCRATERRMNDLHVTYLFQDIKDKYSFLLNFINELKIKKEEVCYIGDDLNDYKPMTLAGFVACPKDSCKEILKISAYISKNKGGHGAVRDIIEYILTVRKQWSEAIENIYNTGI